MAPADCLAASRLGRGCAFARSDGEEDAAAIIESELKLTTDHLVISSNGNPSALLKPMRSSWYPNIALRTGISNTPFVIP